MEPELVPRCHHSHVLGGDRGNVGQWEVGELLPVVKWRTGGGGGGSGVDLICVSCGYE